MRSNMASKLVKSVGDRVLRKVFRSASAPFTATSIQPVSCAFNGLLMISPYPAPNACLLALL